ncbi:unnamed protein product [Diamesa serratosioi]
MVIWLVFQHKQVIRTSDQCHHHHEQQQHNGPVKMVFKNGVLMAKQKQRRYRTERPLDCLKVYIVCLFLSHQRFIGRTVDLILIVILVLMITIDENTVSLHLATFVDIRINGGMEC